MYTVKKRRTLLPPIDLVKANKLDTTDRNPFAQSRKSPDIRTITYPDGIRGVHFDLDEDAKYGLIRYDRDFLLQFMPVCKDKPEMLPLLEAIGLEPNSNIPVTRGGSGRHRQGAPVPSRQGFVALGTSSGTASSPNPFGMGKNHITIPASKLTSEERFAKSNEKIFASTSKLEPITPAGNTGMVHILPTVEEDSTLPEVVSRNVKVLLSSLTMENLDVISDRIIHWANMPENEKDGRTLKLVVHLVVEEATDNAIQSGIFASLCKKMMKNVSPRVHDINIFAGQGKCMAGSKLFRKHLHDRCLSDVDHGWLSKATAMTSGPQSTRDKRAAAAFSKLRSHEDGKDDPVKEATLSSNPNEDEPMRKAKRQCLAIIKFIGELFEQRGLLKKRIIYQCLNKFLGPVNPDEEDVESVCMLLTAVGRQLDKSRKARTKVDKYISRMDGWTEDPNIAKPMRDMLIEVIRLRERKWVSHPVVPAIARSEEIREIASLAANVDNFKYQAVVAEGNGLSPPFKTGDLSTFGKVIQPQSIFVDKEDVAETQKKEVENTGRNEDGSDAASGMIAMRMPPEVNLMGEVLDIQSRRQNSEEQTVIAFLEGLVQTGMCSTALIPVNEKHDAIKSIVNDIASQAPDALRKLSLMVKGGGQD